MNWYRAFWIRGIIFAARIDLLDWGVGIRPASRDDGNLGLGLSVQVLTLRVTIARISSSNWRKVRGREWINQVAEKERIRLRRKEKAARRARR